MSTQDIEHCIKTIMGTQKGSVPLLPELGCDLIQAVGQPAPVAIKILKIIYTKEIAKQEPRCKIVSIIGNATDSGKIHMKVYYQTIYSNKIETTEIYI